MTHSPETKGVIAKKLSELAARQFYSDARDQWDEHITQLLQPINITVQQFEYQIKNQVTQLRRISPETTPLIKQAMNLKENFDRQRRFKDLSATWEERLGTPFGKVHGRDASAEEVTIGFLATASTRITSKANFDLLAHLCIDTALQVQSNLVQSPINLSP